MKTKIEYDGDTLVFTEGSVIKLHCKDEKMVDDLIITVYDDTSSGGDTGGDTGGDVGGGEEEKVYTLSGKWAFNPAPKKPSFSSYEISFTSTSIDGSNKYTDMTFSSTSLMYGTSKTAYIWGKGWDAFSPSRVVDFGSTPVTVSKEFNEWFTANATEARILNSGDWVLWETISGKEVAAGRVFIDFTAPNIGQMYDHIQFDTPTSIYYGRGPAGWHIDTLGEGWRYITFATPQAVPADFYEWFIANAYRELSGTWTFNESVTLPDAAVYANFNGLAKFGDVTTYAVDILPEQLKINAQPVSRDWYVLYTAGLWTREIYRTVTFDETIGVPDDFCAWFTSNAYKKGT